jgi:hypothetical protein
MVWGALIKFRGLTRHSRGAPSFGKGASTGGVVLREVWSVEGLTSS